MIVYECPDCDSQVTLIGGPTDGDLGLCIVCDKEVTPKRTSLSLRDRKQRMEASRRATLGRGQT